MRNRIGADGANCTPSAQATASEARANAATKLSPSPCSTGRTPSWVATTSHTTWFRRAIAAVICSGWGSHSRVEPSTSASSSVTVPVGSSLTPNSLQFSDDISACVLMLASIRDTEGQNISAKAQIPPDRGRNLRPPSAPLHALRGMVCAPPAPHTPNRGPPILPVTPLSAAPTRQLPAAAAHTRIRADQVRPAGVQSTDGGTTYTVPDSTVPAGAQTIDGGA